MREFADWVWARLVAREVDGLLDYRRRAPDAARAHPTEEHLLPLYVALGAAGDDFAAERVHAGIDDYVLAMDAYAFTTDAALIAPLLTAPLNESPSRSKEPTMNKFATISAIAAIVAGLATPAFAAPETYVIDPTHTYPRFSYSHLGLSTQLSRFDKTTGTVVLDKAAQDRFGGHRHRHDVGGHGLRHVQRAHPGARTSWTRPGTRPRPSSRPRSTFEGDKPAAIDGHLTIKGVTRPVTLKVSNFVNMLHPMLKKDAIGADASDVIKRSDFNAGKYAPNVGDEVTISIALEAVKP